MPCAARNARLKSAALENPHRAAIAATGRDSSSADVAGNRVAVSECGTMSTPQSDCPEYKSAFPL